MTGKEMTCNRFNQANPVGSRVRFWTGLREGEGRVGETTCAAYVLGGHTPVVHVANAERGWGSVALTHVQPEPRS